MTDPPVTQFRDLLRLLSESQVEFVVVGGVAAFRNRIFDVELDEPLYFGRKGHVHDNGSMHLTQFPP